LLTTIYGAPEKDIWGKLFFSFGFWSCIYLLLLERFDDIRVQVDGPLNYLLRCAECIRVPFRGYQIIAAVDAPAATVQRLEIEEFPGF
jgi:hypothetical protein